MMNKPAYEVAGKNGGIRQPGRRREAPESTLMSYFRDMTGTALLTPERETELAREIEGHEVEIWTALLSYPAGSMYRLPANVAHFQAAGPSGAVVQIESIGPTRTDFIRAD